jgi:hypothetical protein
MQEFIEIKGNVPKKTIENYKKLNEIRQRILKSDELFKFTEEEKKWFAADFSEIESSKNFNDYDKLRIAIESTSRYIFLFLFD